MANLFLLPTAKSKWTVFWWLGLIACGQLALGSYLHRCTPYVCDPIYGNRYRSLQDRLAENPDRPLVLFLGSSRVMNGIWPTALVPAGQSSTSSPLIYNFGISGSGPISTRLTFRSLLQSGIRPKWLVLETWPLLWPQTSPFDEKRTIAQFDLRWSDLPALHRYLPGHWDILGKAVYHDAAPLMTYRSRLLQATAQFLLPRQVAAKITAERRDWQPVDGTGWIPVRETTKLERRHLEWGQATARPLLNPLRIHPSSDLAIRDLLEDCKAHQIQVALLFMPEHSESRKWYSPQAKELVRSYLDGLIREYHVTVMDTTNWLPDDDFADYCHLTRAAAAPFSERLGRELFCPWLNAGKQP